MCDGAVGYLVVVDLPIRGREHQSVEHIVVRSVKRVVTPYME